MPKSKSLRAKYRFSKTNLLIFVIVFGCIGGYIVYRSFAAGSGITYYVSPTGSDSNNGTSQATPWKTIGKVNGFCFQPGDSVLFQAGQTFSDIYLGPNASCSGTPSSPITFASYGIGRALINNGNGAIYITSGAHDFSFSNLDLSSSGGTIVASQGTGSGTTNIVLSNSIIHDSPYSGVVTQHTDTAWTIQGNTFRHLGDSGIIMQAGQTTIDSNTITDTGWNTAFSYGKHGIYDKAADSTLTNNDISSDTNGSGISIRYHGANLYGNKIHDTPYAISFFPQDPANAGIDLIYDNKMWNISDWAFYYAGSNDKGIDGNPNAAPTAMDVVIASNTIQLSAGAAYDSQVISLSELTVAHVWVVNNIITGIYTYTYAGCPNCQEYNNDWYGGSTQVPAGAGDQYINPNLTAAPAFVLPSNSPLIDKGNINVPNLSYRLVSDGAPLHYAGTAPDIGAVEYFVPAPKVPGDLNTDGHVSVSDLAILLSNYNTSNSIADINSDGMVTVLDLSILLSHYGI